MARNLISKKYITLQITIFVSHRRINKWKLKTY